MSMNPISRFQAKFSHMHFLHFTRPETCEFSGETRYRVVSYEGFFISRFLAKFTRFHG